MILLDQNLDLGPLPYGKRVIRGDQNLPPHPKPASPSAVWRRSSLPWAERLPTPKTLARFVAEAQAAVRLRGEVSVLLTTDRAIRRLNRRFRSNDKTTDVLSFPPSNLVQNQEENAGDLAISVETARRQAAEAGHALTCELQVLILHGLLHLAGFDHESDNGRMAHRERELRARFGLPLGLIERAKATADSHSTPVACATRAQGRLSTRSSAAAAELAQDDNARGSAHAGASRREATRIAQGGVRRSERNPGNGRPNRSRRPVGPARTSARSQPQ